MMRPYDLYMDKVAGAATRGIAAMKGMSQGAMPMFHMSDSWKQIADHGLMSPIEAISKGSSPVNVEGGASFGRTPVPAISQEKARKLTTVSGVLQHAKQEYPEWYRDNAKELTKGLTGDSKLKTHRWYHNSVGHAMPSKNSTSFSTMTGKPNRDYGSDGAIVFPHQLERGYWDNGEIWPPRYGSEVAAGIAGSSGGNRLQLPFIKPKAMLYQPVRPDHPDFERARNFVREQKSKGMAMVPDNGAFRRGLKANWRGEQLTDQQIEVRSRDRRVEQSERDLAANRMREIGGDAGLKAMDVSERVAWKHRTSKETYQLAVNRIYDRMPVGSSK